MVTRARKRGGEGPAPAKRRVSGAGRAQKPDLATFPEENPSPVLRVLGDGGVLYANRAAHALPGLFKKGVLVAELRDEVVAAYAAKRNRSVEFPSGERTFVFYLTPVKGEAYVNLYGRDVTDERRAHRQAQDLAKFPSENPAPVLRVLGDGKLLYANQAARRLSGLLRRDVLTPELREAVVAAHAARRNRSVELQDGARTYVFYLTPVRGESYVNIYGRDATDERRAHRQVQDLAKFPSENPFPVLRVQGDGELLYANQAAQTLPGLLKKGVLAAALRHEVVAAYKAKRNHPVEFQSGERTFLFYLTPVSGEAYVNLYGRDVTDERRAHRQAQDLAKFPSENPSPVLRIRGDGELLYANEAAHALPGLLDGGALAPSIRDAVVAAYDEKQNRPAEFRSDDRTFLFYLTPVSGEAYVNLYGRDVTDERRAHQQVIDVKNFNEAILANLSNGIITVDDSHRITKVNAAAQKLLHLSEPEVLGRDAAEMLGPRNEWLIEQLESALGGLEPVVLMERELELAKGERISANVSIVPMTNLDDQKPGCMIVLDDITREKRIKGTMVRFMSDSVVEQLLRVDESLLSGTHQEVTILFSDIREFTNLSERLGAKEMVSVLNSYFASMVDIIFDYRGTLDKFIGDAIMAVFGAPFSSSEDADNAVLAAVEMLKRLRAFNEELAASHGETIDIGVGLDSGPVVAGTIGSPKRMDYTVIGEHVNLASRIEAANKYFGSQILVSEYTLSRLGAPGRYRELDRVRVQGRERPVTLYEILDHHTDESFPNIDRVLEAFARGLQCYRERDWARAADCFTEALQGNNRDRPTQIYLDRCWRFQARSPEAAWDGVTYIGVP